MLEDLSTTPGAFVVERRRYRTSGRLRVALPAEGKLALGTARAFLSSQRDSRVVACPCGASHDLRVTESDRHGLPYPLKVCARCGLLRMSPQPAGPTLAWFYDNVYRDLYGPHGPSTDALFNGKKWKSALVERALARAGIAITEGPVVDIGCGGGWTLHAFAERGLSCVGYDFDQRLLELGRARGLELRLGSTEQALTDGIKAKLLICGHVLEHVTDPVMHIQSLAPLLAADGLLYLEVPHVRRIGARLRGDALLYWQRAHLWEFQREHVIAFAARAGMTTIWSDEDEDNAYLLCKPAAGPHETPWPALGPQVTELLRSFERQRRTLGARLRSLGSRARGIVETTVVPSLKRRVQRYL